MKSISKQDYFFDGILKEKYLDRGWLLIVFGIIPKNHTHDECQIKLDNNKLYVNINNEELEVEDYEIDEPLYNVNERLIVPKHLLRSLHTDVLTTYGILLANLLLIENPYQGAIDYINGEFKTNALDALAAEYLKKDTSTIEEHHKFENALVFIRALSHIVIVSASRKSITCDKRTVELKKKLLEEHKDNLTDATVVARIQDQIQAMDAEYLKYDPTVTFNSTKKNKISRLKIMGMVGAETDFIDEGKITIITNSLTEGITPKDIPSMANVVRGGSYNRGANTALGGASVKEVARVFQNMKIVDKTCDTKVGIFVPITPLNSGKFVGRYLVGKNNPLTKSELESHIGKTLEIRSTTYCTSEGSTFCRYCVGDVISNSGVGINALMMNCLSTFLSLFMAMMHGTQLSVCKYSYKDRIT